MYAKEITYNDYNGVERKETFLFDLSEAEILEMELSTVGGFEQYVNRIINAQDTPQLVKLFKELILKAYGVKSDDGRRFIKNDKLREEFSQTPAYSKLFMELATDAQAAAEFVNKIVPESMSDVDNSKIKSISPTLELNKE